MYEAKVDVNARWLDKKHLGGVTPAPNVMVASMFTENDAVLEVMLEMKYEIKDFMHKKYMFTAGKTMGGYFEAKEHPFKGLWNAAVAEEEAKLLNSPKPTGRSGFSFFGRAQRAQVKEDAH